MSKMNSVNWGNLVRIYDGGEPITLILWYRFAFNYFPSFMACEWRIILTNITVVSQKLVAAIPRSDFNKFTYVTRHRTLEEGNVVEKNFVTFHFDIVCLMNDGTHMNIPTDYRPSMIWCLTSIDLIVEIRSVKMRCKWGEEERSIAQDLPIIISRRRKKLLFGADKIWGRKTFLIMLFCFICEWLFVKCRSSTGWLCNKSSLFTILVISHNLLKDFIIELFYSTWKNIIPIWERQTLLFFT